MRTSVTSISRWDCFFTCTMSNCSKVIKGIICIVGLCFLSGCANTVPERDKIINGKHLVADGEIVLRVTVTKIEYTGWFQGCGEVEDCLPFHSWFEYKADVKEVVHGHWDSPDVEFAYLQHARYIDEVTKDCYVILRPANADFRSDVGVVYIARDLLSKAFKHHRVKIKDLLKLSK